MALSSCAHNHEHDHEHEHEHHALHNEPTHNGESHHHDDESHHHGDDIIMEPEKAAAAGVEASTVSRGTFHDVIVTSGKLLAASCDETTIVATVSGIVTHAQHISEGMDISQGTVLYHIASASLQDGDQSERARISYLAAKREYDRALPLVEDKIISEKDFSIIRTDYETARLAYEAIGRETTDKGVSVKAPMSGYMKQCMVKDGDYVQVGDPILVLTRNQHLYLRAEVPVRYYSQLGNIRSAKFRTQFSDKIFDLEQRHGTLLSSGKSAVSTSSYVPVTFQLDNHGDIVPGAYAEVFLIAGERSDVISLPQTALTEEQGIYYIYIQEDEHAYHKQEVTLGATDGENTEITSGLNGGERVVTRGAISVKLAGTSKAIPGHTHSH
ncbi:MAG: efflux RND transporter periplasmic adaptor subunit [Bacteroidales bacterium]|nr:efflux RND transporter periplasmic adaptor subunit [Candidatus Liminaster caballi]